MLNRARAIIFLTGPPPVLEFGEDKGSTGPASMKSRSFFRFYLTGKLLRTGMRPRGNASLRLRNSLLGVNSFVAFPWSYMKKN